MESHDEFRELCAIATSGELSEQEQRKLREHLTGCPECRQALREFEAVVDVGVPLLASQLSAEHSERSASTQPTDPKSNDIEESVVAAPSWVGMDGGGLGSDAAEPGFVFAQRNRSGRKQMNWNYVWFSFAACVLLTIALGFYAYRVGKTRIVNVAHTVPVGNNAQVQALEQQISDAGREREGLRMQLAQRDRDISDLERKIQEESVSVNDKKDAKAKFANSIQDDEAEKQRVAQAQSELSQKLGSAQASLTKAQSELGVVTEQRSEVEMRAASLEAQVRDLSGELRESELTVGKQEELLG